jgi:hypothetical protein
MHDAVTAKKIVKSHDSRGQILTKVTKNGRLMGGNDGATKTIFTANCPPQSRLGNARSRLTLHQASRGRRDAMDLGELHPSRQSVVVTLN